ncbi:MAG: efflux RND transporter periplasmic adaptor subunit [Rhodothermales bacterium]
MKKILLIVAALVLTGATIWFFNRSNGEEVSPYRFVTVEQGDLEAVVSSTGTLDAVTTVQVGTQVSGIISEIYADFNDNVRKGQLIARIDTTLLVSAVRDAEINLERNRAQLRQAEREFERIKGLFEKQFITEVEFNKAQYDLDIAHAATKSAEISLERARQNFSYATIYAPISGTVIERNVEVGQTVAASFSAPQLFLIADDLSHMEILASVDESDIGMIKEGQTARFTVQAYPDETFTGAVRQVRLQSTMQENVVNYTVVIDVENKEGTLLPGMTATVDFLIETATDVLKIPNAALRFRPTEEMIAAFRERRRQQRENRPDSLRNRGDERRGRRGDTADGNDQGSFGQRSGGQRGSDGGGFGGFGGFGGGQRPNNFTMLWFLDEAGNLSAAPVRTGISDGQMTEIRGRQIEPGMQIIAGVTQTTQSRSTNPFQNQQQGGRRRPGGF